MLYRNLINNVKRGLGSAYLEVSNSKDKEKYRETIEYCITHNCSYDLICEGSKGDYLYNLIELYDDKNYFIDIVKRMLYENKSINIGLFHQLLDILMVHYYSHNEDIKVFMKDYYNYFYNNGRWTKRKIECYDYLCSKMSYLFGLKMSKKIIKDIEKVGIELSDLWFSLSIELRYKNDEYIQSISHKDNKSNNKDYTFSGFLDSMNKDKSELYLFSLYVNEEELEKCENFLKTSYDKEIICKILKDFQSDFKNKAINEDILFGLIDKFDDEIKKEVYNTLAYYKSKKVEELGLVLIDSEYYKQAIHMLITNYKPQYKDILEQAYKKVKYTFDKYETLTYEVCDLMATKRKNMPDEILLFIYNNDYCSFRREYIVKCMNKRNLLTKEIIDELKYDSNYEVRKYAYKYIDNIKLKEMER